MRSGRHLDIERKMADYDGTVTLSRKLTDDEIRELKIVLLPYFHSAGGLGGDEDITDFLDYVFAMISNSKTIEYIVNELVGMEMEFCNEQVAHKVGKEISSFVAKLNAPESAAATPSGAENQPKKQRLDWKGSEEIDVSTSERAHLHRAGIASRAHASLEAGRILRENSCSKPCLVRAFKS